MIEFKNVSFTYDSVDRNAGIYNVNLKIDDGEVIVFCGESGCGKTTISRLSNGLIPGYYTGTLEGEVIVRDYKISQNPIDELSRYVGSVFQNPRTQFFNVDSTSEIAFACENFEVPREEICTRIGKVTQELNIRNLLDRNLFSMSGGEKQKIACASAAVMEPEIYVLDEPSSNLDIGTIEMLKAIINKWKEKKATIIIAEHRLRYLIDIADKFIYMKDGQIHTIFTNEEFKRLSNDILNNMGLRSINPVNFKDLKNFIKVDSKINIKNFEFSYNKTPFLNIKNTLLPQNAIIAVLGSNGSGKSTFSKCLCGVEEKAKGVLEIETDTYSTRERLRKCFMVMQDVNHQLFTESVKEEILLSIEDNENEEQMVKEICKKLNLMEFLDCHPMSLSGGQKQRVAIAGVVALRPDILILDEATSMLDPEGRLELIKIVQKIRQDHQMTVISITHDLDEVAMSDRVLVMKKGEVESTSTPRELFSRSDLDQIGLDQPFVNQLKESLRTSGLKLPEHYLTEEELEEALWELF